MLDTQTAYPKVFNSPFRLVVRASLIDTFPGEIETHFLWSTPVQGLRCLASVETPSEKQSDQTGIQSARGAGWNRWLPDGIGQHVVEQLDPMPNRSLRRGGKMRNTSDVGGNDQVRFSRVEGSHLVVSQLRSEGGLRDGVCPRGTATEMRIGRNAHVDVKGAQQAFDRAPYLLSVLQRAGRVKRHPAPFVRRDQGP